MRFTPQFRARFGRKIPALGLVLAVVLLSATALAQQSITPAVQGVDSIGITVADMDRSIEFYSKVLTFEKSPMLKSRGKPTNISRGSSACGCGWCGCGWETSSSS